MQRSRSLWRLLQPFIVDCERKECVCTCTCDYTAVQDSVFVKLESRKVTASAEVAWISAQSFEAMTKLSGGAAAISSADVLLHPAVLLDVGESMSCTRSL
jgi:hypothetical protein